MKLRNVEALKLFAVCGALGGFGLTWALLVGRANFAQAGNKAAPAIVGLPEDWTHHHVIYTDSGPVQVMARAQQDPRYWLQQLKRHGAEYADVFNLRRGAPLIPRDVIPLPPLPRIQARKRTSVDWNVSLGGAGGGSQPGAGLADGQFPAKFSFDVNATPDCTNDFAVYAENPEGFQPVAATATGTFSSSGQGTTGQTATITNGANSITLTATGAYAGATGTFASNGVSGGKGVTITNGPSSINLTASTPTAAAQTGSFSSLLSSTTGNITVHNTSPSNTLTLTTNATRGSATGTFSARPLSATAVTVTSGANTLTMTTNATPKTATGTFTAAPSAGTMTLTSGSNILTLTNSGTGANATGTFSAPPSSTTSPTITITSGANTLTLTTNATAAHSTGTFNGTPSAGQTMTIHNGLDANSLVLTAATSGSNACTSATAGTFVTSATTSTEANNLRDAINNCNTSFPAVGFTATSSTNTTTVTAVNPGSGFTFAESAGGFSWGSTVNGTNGSNTCPSSTAGTFATSSSTTTLAANLTAAINACPVAAGVTAASSTNTVTATSRTPGSFTTFSVGAANNTGIFSWGVANAGTDGANACSTSTTGTFATSSSTSTLASNVATAIGLCSAAAGVSASPTANTVAVTATTPGSITFTVADSLSNFAWGAVSGGSDGSNTCPTSTGGTFASNSSTTTLATNLRTAIGLCPAAAAVTATSSTNTVTVTSATLGSSTLSVGASNNSGIFSWGAVTAGSNGTNTCPTNTTGTFAVDSTTSGLASNLAAAINACLTPATVGVTAGASGSTVTLTAATLGTGGNSITLADTSSAFAWTAGTLAGGTDGSNTGTNFQFWSGSAPLSTTAVATNLAAAIQRNGATVGVGSTSSANVVTVTATTLGTAGNTIGLTENISSGFAWSGGTLAGGVSGSDTGTNFSISSNTTTEATNLALAINRSGATPGVSATSSANVVTVTATLTGPSGNSITLAEGLGNFTWGGATLAGGAAGQATLVAFNNLYSNYPAGGLCGFAPTVKWAYNTTRGATSTGIPNSPVLSLDGTKVAYLENTTPLTFHVLTIGTTGNNGADPIGPVMPCTIITDGSFSTACATNNAVDVRVSVGTASSARHSSVFVDYTNDVAYVTPDDGDLYQITGVFNGSPALAGAPFPLAVSLTSNGKILTSPVLDSVTQRLFIGTGDGLLKMVRLSASDPCTGSVPAPCVDSTAADLNSTGSHSIIDPPIVDSTNQTIFITVNDDGAQHALAAQATTSLGRLVTVQVGKNTGQPAHAGTLDNAYFTSPSSGHFYVCGTSVSGADPSLYSIGFTGSTMKNSTDNGPLALSGTSNSCSPVTEFFNPNIGSGGADMIFVSVQNACSATVSGGCMRAFDITSGFPASTTGAGVSTVAEIGGTSGIVVDNVGNTTTFPQASSLYFSNLSNTTCTGVTGGACAIKLTQSGLQ